MLFNSLAYLIFLPTVVLLFWLSPKLIRTGLLLVASYVFYMSWKPIYGILIAGLTLANYFFGLLIDRHAPGTLARKGWMVAAVSANLLSLAYFKYTYFLFDLTNDALKPFGQHLPSLPMQIILPLGISFFVFEFIHYVVDVYKGGKPVRSLLDFSLFASFFPTQIAGPIKRYQDFIPQLSETQRFKLSYLDEGLWLILFGLFKKVLFADNLATVVASGFERPDLLTGADLWLVCYAFAFQIYFDFSGYTDIARGSALLFGYKVPVNFNLPYLANSIADFWHRWHISLSTWLRDYLYIPLGGSRCSKWFNYRNLFLTMALGGLWHGASMHFLVWGAYQGLMLILHKEWRNMAELYPTLKTWTESKLFHVFSIVLTFHVVCIGWVFFRAESIESALSIISKLCFLESIAHIPAWQFTIMNLPDPVIFMVLPLILAILFAGQLLAAYLNTKSLPALKLPLFARAMAMALLIAGLIVLSPDTSPKFIYFQF